jgi:two-component system sensor histidine kinase KdpD
VSKRDGPAWREYLLAVAIVGLSTGLGFVFRPHLQTTDLAMLYLLAVVAVATRASRGATLVATLLGIAAFDLVFVPPYYTFAVHNPAYVLTFGVMLAVALVMSGLTERIRHQALDAQERERRTAAMYGLSRDLTDADGRPAQLATAERHLAQAVGGEATFVLVDESGDGAGPVWSMDGLLADLETRVAARWAYDHGESAGMGTAHCAEAEALAVPLAVAGRRLGIALAAPEPGGHITLAERRTVEALAGQTAMALERTLLDERHERAQLEVEAERLRTALLSSLSHDLRTPLGTIQGAASSLLHEPGALSDGVRTELAGTIVEESRRMMRLVTNLLDMVRVEAGGLAVRKEWQPLEEALGVAVLRVEERLAEHPLEVRLPPDLPLVPVDGLLLEQVFINLLENAAKHTPPGTAVKVSAWADDSAVTVEVADNGPGVPPADREAVFRKFYRGASAETGGGAGLGLAICRGILAAHGGRIWLEPSASGAAFRFVLPLDGPPMASLPDEP